MEVDKFIKQIEKSEKCLHKKLKIITLIESYSLRKVKYNQCLECHRIFKIDNEYYMTILEELAYRKNKKEGLKNDSTTEIISI